MNDFEENEQNEAEFPPLDFSFRLSDTCPALEMDEMNLYSSSSCNIFSDSLDMWPENEDLALNNGQNELITNLKEEMQDFSLDMIGNVACTEEKKKGRGPNKRVHALTPKIVKKVKGNEKKSESLKEQEEKHEKRLEANKKIRTGFKRTQKSNEKRLGKRSGRVDFGKQTIDEFNFRFED
eukprot:TRINITY_DN1093_c0_g1_i3.p1 TRINITY_DN1093_c0_g1~~TRINITY_DN1093_c0_g1_i3.p1  ORF type:complete len:180 (-),score=50.13 TRINITY_DN1093_c0_g1_i3:520-1059(-)